MLEWARGSAPAVLGCALLLGGCAPALEDLARDDMPAPLAVDGLASALACRFGPIDLDPVLLAARAKFARYSLSPSRLFDDAGLWARRDGAQRVLELQARPGLPYRVEVRPQARAPVEAGAYRGSIRLTALGSSDFQWVVRDELSVGRVRAPGLAGAWASLLAGLENESDARLRDLVHREMPRSAAAFGRLFTLEPVAFAPVAGGGTAVTLAFRAEPERLRDRFPKYARFIEEYLFPARLRLVLADTSGAPYAELRGEKGRVVLRARLDGGALGPLQGTLRPLPDRLRLTAAASAKAGFVRVGVDALVGEVRLSRSDGEIGLHARFTEEPEWQLPFVLKPFLRAPLRRPFEGEGALLTLGVHEGEGGSTVLDREYRLAVRESWIVRWLGSFGGGMVTAFRAGAEAEADRFMGECLWALRDDLVALATSDRARPRRGSKGGRVKGGAGGIAPAYLRGGWWTTQRRGKARHPGGLSAPS